MRIVIKIGTSTITHPTGRLNIRQMEALCKVQNLPGRLIPTPRELTADCGMAWCAPLDAEETLRALADAHHLEYADWQELLV